MSKDYDDRYPQGARREHLDPRPMAVPVGFSRPPSLIEQMRSMIRNEFSQAAMSSGRETFEEANDFDVPEDPEDPTTPWEHAADGDDEVAEGLQGARHAREARKAGWKPSAREAAWESWARANGWVPPQQRSEPAAPAQPQAASAAAVNGGNPLRPHAPAGSLEAGD